MKILKLNSTHDAIQLGIAIRNNQRAKDIILKKRALLLDRFNRLLNSIDRDNLTTEERRKVSERAFSFSMKTQFLREALDSAEDKEYLREKQL